MRIEGMEAPRMRKPSRLAQLRPFAALLLVFLLGAYSKSLVDATQWKTAAPAARAALSDPTSDTQERRDAVIVLQRDVEASLALLRARAASNAEDAVHARNALHWIMASGK